MMVGHTHIDIDQIFSRLAEYVKDRCIFTRTQQGEAFKAAYRTVPVSCVCLRNLGNFKGLLHSTTKKIANITKPRSFLIERGVDGDVCVSFKEFMHSAEWTGMDREGRFLPTAPSHRVFIGPVPRMRDAPDYVLKEVEEKTVRNIEQRYRASYSRLQAAYLFDSDKVEQAKAEMQMSADLLRVKGSKPFDLPTYWLREDEDSDSDSDNSSIYDDSETSFDGNSDGDSQSEGGSSNGGDSGSGSGGGSGGGAGIGSGDDSGSNSGDNDGNSDGDSDALTTKGHFAFFLADQAPFLVGQITDVRRAQDGAQEGNHKMRCGFTGGAPQASASAQPPLLCLLTLTLKACLPGTMCVHN